MIIRKVKPEEAANLLALAEFTFRAGFQHLNDPVHFEEYMNKAFNPAKIRQELATPGSSFYFGELDGDLVGYIKLNSGQAQSDLKSEPGMELERIYVKPEYQGKKIGQLLLYKAIKIASEGQFPYLWLGVWEKNEAAIRFYHRHGFSQFGSHTFVLGNDPQTDLLLKLPLNGYH